MISDPCYSSDTVVLLLARPWEAEGRMGDSERMEVESLIAVPSVSNGWHKLLLAIRSHHFGLFLFIFTFGLFLPLILQWRSRFGAGLKLSYSVSPFMRPAWMTIMRRVSVLSVRSGRRGYGHGAICGGPYFVNTQHQCGSEERHWLSVPTWPPNLSQKLLRMQDEGVSLPDKFVRSLKCQEEKAEVWMKRWLLSGVGREQILKCQQFELNWFRLRQVSRL